MPRAGGRPPAGVPRQRLFQVRPQAYRGVAYRVIGARFLASPLVSAGSRLRGGRFNPAGEFEVLYAALAVDTAFAERDGLLLTAAGIKAAALVRTGVLLTLRCRLAAVLDLTDERVRARLGVSLGGVVGSWVAWSSAASSPAPSQTIGRSVHASRRFEGILYPSTKDAGGRCLAVFPDRLRTTSRIAVADPDGVIRAALGLAPGESTSRRSPRAGSRRRGTLPADRRR